MVNANSTGEQATVMSAARADDAGSATQAADKGRRPSTCRNLSNPDVAEVGHFVTKEEGRPEHGRSLPGKATIKLSLERTDSIKQWKAEGRIAVWLHIPIQQSRLIASAASEGFTFHHAEATSATMALWLGDGHSRLPGYATHQVGVAGAVLDEDTGKVLVVQDKNKTTNAWKFPGGLSEQSEDIGDTAVREVLEETGIKSEFKSILSIRQQHNHPGAFGKSDMYIICRLAPISYFISFCPRECLKCEWMDLVKLATTSHATPITSRVAKLLLYGYRQGFEKIDLTMEEYPAVYSGLVYKLYHRELPENLENCSQSN